MSGSDSLHPGIFVMTVSSVDLGQVWSSTLSIASQMLLKLSLH